MIHEAFLGFGSDEIMARLKAEQVPSAPVNSLDDVFVDPQVVHNEIVHTWHDPRIGTIRQAKPPVQWSVTEHEPVWSVDALGESTEEVLRAHGYDDEALAALRAGEVIA